MSSLKASATYKKADGTLELNEARTSISWTPKATGPSKVQVAIADITNLQQTPPQSERNALKIFVGTNESHVFYFKSEDARAEQEALIAPIKAAIIKAGSGSTPRPDQDTGEKGPSAAMAIAQAVTSRTKAAEGWYDDHQLKSNAELQQSLLRADDALRERFEQSLRDKPDSITNFQFAQQFWSARMHLLRAHAIEKHQSQGAYNVLAEVKPKIVDGATRLNLSKEQIQLIFSQHPIVKHVYNEVVPKLSERDFWARFFVSRLFKKLKGERITDSDSTDAVLDKYLKEDEDSLRQKQLTEAPVPHFIDLEGNEQNHSQRKGNKPDFTMRPNDKMPILHVLNSMSEKMLSRVAPQDDEETSFDELRLRDLQTDKDDDRVVLHIKDQRRLFGASPDNDKTPSRDPAPSSKQHPAKVLASLRADLSQQLDLPGTAESSNASAKAALSQISALISQQHALLSAPTSTLSPEILTSLRMTHSTTTEFLHYFWTLLLRPPSAATQKELSSLLGTLANSLDRIKAVGDEAEAERQGKVRELREAAHAYEQRTGKRRKVDEGLVTVGGRNEVEGLMAPTVTAIGEAKARFEAIVWKAGAAA